MKGIAKGKKKRVVGEAHPLRSACADGIALAGEGNDKNHRQKEGKTLHFRGTYQTTGVSVNLGTHRGKILQIGNANQYDFSSQS